MIEFPKILYKGEGEAREERRVVDAEAEAAAKADGFESPRTVAPVESGVDAIKAAPTYLEYPKHVYRGEGETRESVVVTSAEDEAAKAADGYLALDAAPAAETPDPAPKKPGRKPKDA